MKNNLTQIIFLTLLITITHKTSYTSTLQSNKVNVEPNECFYLNFTLDNSDNITTAIITFTFDPGKIQIGCTQKFNPDISEVYTFHSNTSPLSSELPIILSDTLTQQNFHYKLAIYPEGVYTVAIWGGSTPIPTGTIFSIPAKLLPSAQPGDILPIVLHPETNSAIVERNFNEIKNFIPLYCSFANINAIPIYPKLINGAVYVATAPHEAESESQIDGESETTEGYQEDGNIDGETTENEKEGYLEGTKEGELHSPNNTTSSQTCGCNPSSPHAMKTDYLIVIAITAMLSTIKKKNT